MNFSFLIWFGIGLVFYLTALAVFVLVKFLINRKRFKKELKQKEELTVIDTSEVKEHGEEEQTNN